MTYPAYSHAVTHSSHNRWGTGWLTPPEADRKARTENLLQLTLPGMMGSRFRVLEGWKGRGA